MGQKDTRRSLGLCFACAVLPWLAAPLVQAHEDSAPVLFIELNDLFTGVYRDDYDQPGQLHVVTLNLNQFFDDVDNGNDEKVLSTRRFQRRVDSVAKSLGDEGSLPHIIALQEIENTNALEHLAREIWRRYRIAYRLVLRAGQDVSGINLAYLVRGALQIVRVEQLFADQLLEYDGSPLFSRPPLLLEACRGESCFSLINLHLRSMRGIDSAEHGERVAHKRRQQAETIAAWCNRLLQKNPNTSLLLLGDFNALTPTDAHVDIAGILRGDPDNRNTRWPARDLIEPDLIDLTLRIPAERRYSFVYRQRKQQLDYMLVNRTFAAELESIEFGRIDRRLSDHALLRARFRL